jgi:transglutaminase-like putative cysteine protease
MRTNSIILFFFCTVSCVAFAGNESLEELKKRYKDEHALYLSEKEHLFIKTNGNEFEIYSDVNWEILYLTDKAGSYGSQNIQFSKFSEIQNIKAYSLIPRNGDSERLKKTKVTKFKTEDVYNGSYFFHDNKQIAFKFPGTEPGTKINLSYREVIKKPQFLGSTFLISYLPTLKSEYSISFPSNVDVYYKLFNTDEIEIKQTKVIKSGVTTLTWKVENQDAYESSYGAPNLRYYTPHIVAYIGEIRLKDTTVTVLPNLDGLYNWYYSLIKDVNLKEDSILKSITDNLIENINSKDEKARIIFNWVQDNIKYVAFEYGMGGFVPRSAASVCRKRYGDCKDMASIITEMMKYADIEANITWIGSNDLPYDYTEIATPIVDNHMIASYRNEKSEVVILDAVGSYTPYGYPTEFIQGKQALISKGEGGYELYRVPVVPKEKNAQTDVVSMRLLGTKLVGKGKIEAEGYKKFNYVYKLANMNNNEDQRSYIESYLEKGNNKFRVDEAKFYGLKNRDTSLTINYSFNLEDYSKTVANETYINLNLDRDYKASKLDIEERNGISRQFNFKQDLSYEVSFDIPEGSVVSYIPENAEFKGEDFGFKISYEEKENKIVLKKKISVDTILIEKSQFKEWNAMIRGLKKAYKEVIVIKKK